VAGAEAEAGAGAEAGKATQLKQGTPMVAVGASFSAQDPATVTVKVTSGSNAFGPSAPSASTPQGQATYFGLDLTADKLTPGTWQIEFFSAEKRSIAAGFLTVLP
jgi:hypothetical protein